jgi:RNA polymerase sigma factor (sigma-70 family)
MRFWEDHSDEELLAATMQEPEAFGVFYRRYEGAVLRFFLARVRDSELAIDLTAESFAAALLAAHRFRRAGAPPEAWLFGIARNVLAMSARRRRVESRARRRLQMPALVVDDRVEELRSDSADADLQALVDGLPPDQRHALHARVVDEREYVDIASELGCSELVVRKRVSRALNSLRQQLGETP